MKNKTTAALLAFFLGAFGAHRFYLGQIGLGFIYLIFCWTFIPYLIAFVDFISFLVMSEGSFNMKYNSTYMAMHQQQPTVVIHNTNNAAGPVPHAGVPQTNHQGASPSYSSNPQTDPFETAGDEKYADYDFDGAIGDYLKSLNVKPNNGKVHFKLACLYSVLEQTDSSFFHLAKAVEKGFYDLDKIKTHDHLSYLRSQQPAFDNFVNNGYKLTKRIPVPAPGLGLTDNVISQIEKLAKLRDQGIISDDEFQAQKSKLLA
jgi:TM2 domain-containing membrane protein YozV